MLQYSQKKDEEQIQSQRARMDEIQQRRDELRRELLQLDEDATAPPGQPRGLITYERRHKSKR
ncbi:von Willebrand factor [Bienertia sinuspersici]